MLVSEFGDFCAVTDDDDCESAGEFDYRDDEYVFFFDSFRMILLKNSNDALRFLLTPILPTIVITVTTTLANGQTGGAVNVIYEYGGVNCESATNCNGNGNSGNGNLNGNGNTNEACRSLSDLRNAWAIYAWAAAVTGITGLAFML